MFSGSAASWYHSQYDAHAECEHCGGIVSHKRWCITRDALVQYAYAAVHDADKLTVSDALILHALGVVWIKNEGQEQT